MELEKLQVILHQSMGDPWTAKKERDQCSHCDRDPAWTNPQTALLSYSIMFLQAILSHIPNRTIADTLTKGLKNTNNNGKL